LQTGTSTTWIYPFKWYSVASSTGSGAQYATTTEYVFNNDSLVATIDQETASGNATGTPDTHYIHPDHLGSTNVVTNASGTVEQTLDYFPYGGTRISTGQNAASRQYIGQFADQSTLDYLNARYYDSSRGQFLTEDPSFLALGDAIEFKKTANREQQEFLADPQLANSYGYGRDNPVLHKDPDGKIVPFIIGALAAYGWAQTYVDYLNYQTVTTYPEEFGDTEIKDTGYKLVSDILLAGVAREAKDVENLVWGAGSAVLDAIDIHCANHTCLNFGHVTPSLQTAPASSNRSAVTGANGMPSLFAQPHVYGSTSQSSNLSIQQAQSTQSSGGGSSGSSYQSQIASIQRQIAQIQAVDSTTQCIIE
jgi:RHS repeat-associated protein